MKKNKLLYLLTILITLFSFNMNAKADDYYFKKNITGDTDSVEYILLDGLCYGDINRNEEKNIPFTCTYYCKNETKFEAYGQSSLSSNGFTKVWQQYKDTCDEIEKYSIKGYETSDKLIEFKNKLINDETIKCGDKDCYSYIIENYCSVNSTEQICKDLSENASNADIIGEGDNQKNVCSMQAKIYKTASNITTDAIKFKAVYEVKKDTVWFTYADNNDYINNGFKTNARENYIEQYSNRYYMYSKGSNSEDFNKKYIDYLNSNNLKCPEITFCMDAIKDNYYIWYAELGDDIDKSKYYICQTIGSDGLSTGLNYDEANLIDKDRINNLSLCDDILVENSAIWKLLKYLVTLIKIAVPLLLIGLGIMDFTKAIFSGNEDGMKKAQAKFIKRLIIGVCIFLIPSLLELVLTISSSIWQNISTDFCGIL